MTYKEAAQSALYVQDACNSSGILHTLTGDVLAAIREEGNRLNQSTRFINQSPIIAMYLYKLGELNGRDISSLNDGYAEAEQQVKTIIHQETLRESLAAMKVAK